VKLIYSSWIFFKKKIFVEYTGILNQFHENFTPYLLAFFSIVRRMFVPLLLTTIPSTLQTKIRKKLNFGAKITFFRKENFSKKC